jgi:hypothetical protein
LGKEIEELRAPMAEMEAALERKTKATTAAGEEEDSEAQVQRRVNCRRVRVVAAAAPDIRDCAVMRRKQLACDRVKARRHPGQFGSKSSFMSGSLSFRLTNQVLGTDLTYLLLGPIKLFP